VVTHVLLRVLLHVLLLPITAAVVGPPLLVLFLPSTAAVVGSPLATGSKERQRYGPYGSAAERLWFNSSCMQQGLTSYQGTSQVLRVGTGFPDKVLLIDIENESLVL
jgi:hypothetical protein